MATLLKRWFLLIEEPRSQRILYMVFYLVIAWSGISALTNSPQKFVDATGINTVYTIALFLIVGGILGALAIVPGTWYLERVALISIGFGLAARGVLIVALSVSSTGALIFASEVILLIIRFLQVRKADLAPSSE
jgi:predicted membrane channel-forming protein YqfA (hemolysin III family)